MNTIQKLVFVKVALLGLKINIVNDRLQVNVNLSA
jgi:hypothetical protein